MTIYLVRHGETDLNATRVLQYPDTPLGARGLSQAQAVGRRFAGTRPAAIIASDMARAWMTAEPIAAATGVPLRASKLLQERNFGDLRGKSYDNLGYDPIHAEEGPPNGESMSVFRARVRNAFDELIALHATVGGDVIAVSHGLVIKIILAELVQRSPEQELPERLGNTSVNVFDGHAPYRVRLMNCLTHLDAGNADGVGGLVGV